MTRVDKSIGVVSIVGWLLALCVVLITGHIGAVLPLTIGMLLGGANILAIGYFATDGSPAAFPLPRLLALSTIAVGIGWFIGWRSLPVLLFAMAAVQLIASVTRATGLVISSKAQ